MIISKCTNKIQRHLCPYVQTNYLVQTNRAEDKQDIS